MLDISCKRKKVQEIRGKVFLAELRGKFSSILLFWQWGYQFNVFSAPEGVDWLAIEDSGSSIFFSIESINNY